MTNTKAAPFPEPVKKGSKEKPFKFDGRYCYPAELEVGFHMFYIIEIQEKKNGPWESTAGDTASTIKDAKRMLKEVQKDVLEDQKDEWQHENFGAQDRAVFHFKVTANTSKEQVEAHVKELKEVKAKFDERKKAMKKAEFVAPEYPRFRIAKKYIEVTTGPL